MKKTFILIYFLLLSPYLFSWENFIIVTTIQYPTPQLCKLAQMEGWRLVVVGDQKTPKDWHLDNCDYLSPDRQLELGYQLATLLPWNHYSRKNIGYLYAIANGAKIIYETDDDNENLKELAPSQGLLPLIDAPDPCINIYSYFGHPEIWPRGFPLEKILPAQSLRTTMPSIYQIGVEQGVINGHSDVDAIFRLTQDRPIEFEMRPPCALPPGRFCPFNSQNTFFHPIAFFTLYLPSFVSMRVTDIWRGYISQRLLWTQGAVLAISGPNAIHNRNAHSLLNDFLLEQALYLQVGSLVDFLSEWKEDPSEDPFQSMSRLFQDLVQRGFLDRKELSLLNAWFMDLKQISARVNTP